MYYFFIFKRPLKELERDGTRQLPLVLERGERLGFRGEERASLEPEAGAAADGPPVIHPTPPGPHRAHQGSVPLPTPAFASVHGPSAA